MTIGLYFKINPVILFVKLLQLLIEIPQTQNTCCVRKPKRGHQGAELGGLYAELKKIYNSSVK